MINLNKFNAFTLLDSVEGCYICGSTDEEVLLGDICHSCGIEWVVDEHQEDINLNTGRDINDFKKVIYKMRGLFIESFSNLDDIEMAIAQIKKMFQKIFGRMTGYLKISSYEKML